MKILLPQGIDALTPSALVDQTGRVFTSRLPNIGNAFLLTGDTAYFVFLGRTTQTLTVKYVEFYLNVLAAGTQSAEVGLFKTANPPNKGTQGTNGIVKLTATGALDTLTAILGVKRNTSAFNYVVPSGTFLWVGIHTAMSTQPTLAGLSMDFGAGAVLSTAVAGPLTNAGPWTGAFPAAGQYFSSAIAPDLRVTLD